MVYELAASVCDTNACKAIELFAAFRNFGLSKKTQTCPPLVDLLELPTLHNKAHTVPPPIAAARLARVLVLA